MKRNASRFIVKKYTTKEWKRFNPNIQAELSRRYTVILTDHKTRQEKFKVMKKQIGKSLSEMGKVSATGGGSRVNYLDQSIDIKSPNTLGIFDMGFGKAKKNNFSNLATFK